MVSLSIRPAWIGALGQYQGSPSGRIHRQKPVAAAAASQDRRTRESPETLLAPGRRLPWRVAPLGPVLLSPRLRTFAHPGLRSDPQRQGRWDRNSDAAHLAAFGP